jgi:glycine hydroxymethyltransferase
LAESDPELFDIVEKEKNRQWKHLELIASENYTTQPVMEALGSCMTNKYSEGYPGARYYGGNDYIDMSERLCQERALEVFQLDPKAWGVNVQSLSGSPANFEVYSALLQPFDRIMSLDLPHGGHLSHGFETPTKKISAVSKYFTIFPYRLNEETGRIDYDTLAKNAISFRPKLIVAGASAYARHIDYARMRTIADSVGAKLLMDMAHISGLVAGRVLPSPFEYADIVSTTTHKSLRGPRGAMIFFKKEFEEAINFSVFPGHQGGPHNHTIAALATALKQANTEEFRSYQQQVVSNSKRLAHGLMDRGYLLISNGTDNHLCLVNVKKSVGIDGQRLEYALERSSITTNKNTVPGDTKALVPGGIRLGTPAITSRGMVEKDIDIVVDFLDRSIKIAVDMRKQTKGKKVAHYRATVDKFAADPASPLSKLRKEVEAFAKSFPVPSFDVETMKYKD